MSTPNSNTDDYTVRGFIEYVCKCICENPDEVQIEEIKGDRTISINVKCAKSDIGKIIGKKGHVANTIRILAQHMAFKTNSRVSITVID